MKIMICTILLAAEQAQNVLEQSQSEGSSLKWLVFFIGFCAIIIFFYWYGSKKKREGQSKIYNIADSLEEVCDGELNFEDVIAYFKTLNLNSQEDVPLIAQNPSDNIFSGIIAPKKKFEKDGYKALFLGVYNKKTDVLSGKMVYAKSLDSKIKETLGKESFVTLG